MRDQTTLKWRIGVGLIFDDNGQKRNYFRTRKNSWRISLRKGTQKRTGVYLHVSEKLVQL